YLCCALLGAGSLILWLRKCFQGAVDTGDVQNYLNAALRTVLTRAAGQWDETEKRHPWSLKTSTTNVEAEDPRSFITFEDLFIATGIQLTIVTADVVRNEVFVFNTETHKKYPVAKAVAASMAIPFAFRPVTDYPKLLVDGGLVSTIPAWVYRRNRTR